MALVFPVAAAALGGAYLNARYVVGHDLKVLRQNTAFRKQLARNIRRLGDEATLYHALEFCDREKEALWFEGRTWTYKEWLAASDRVANLLHQTGVRSGDVVAVFMTNSPELVFTVFGITKLGAVPAMINPALRGQPLWHCLNVSKSILAVASPDIGDALVEATRTSQHPLPCICLHGSSYVDSTGSLSSSDQNLIIANLEELAEPSGLIERPKRTISDIGMLMFTSGTTGMPKACAIKNHRIALMWVTSADDDANPKKFYPLRIYSCLPLIHGTAFFGCLCLCIGSSSTLCIARKFSRSKFWQDVHECRATRLSYVGELCRYLLAAPPSALDTGHAVNVAFGNGLKEDIYEKFKARFQIPEIREIYRATEGVAQFTSNGVGVAGAGKIGRSGPLLNLMECDTYIVKFDDSEEAPYRDPKTGFCVLARTSEPGEAIGRIRDLSLYTEYLGDQAATEQKFLRNVFAKGDLFQRSGDLMVRDDQGWVRFHDRIGDTFRWKGENVSAGEVRDHILKNPIVQDAIVYGTKLPSYDGQVGAVGIILSDGAAESALVDSCAERLRSQGLPQYALPRLLRIMKRMAVNHTFKHLKGALKERSWNPANPQEEGDTLYWLDGNAYRELDAASWAQIEKGLARL